MKNLIVAFGVMSFSVFAQAQSVNVKDIDTSKDDSTTIEIRKGEKASATPAWEVHEGTSDVIGDAALYVKEAKKNWQKACSEWKNEFREDQKTNKIININCGVPNCAKDASEMVCVSKATYKIKTRND